VTKHLHYLLLDCDGVIVNSEEIAQRAELRVLHSIGLPITEKEYSETVLGHSEGQYLRNIRRKLAAASISVDPGSLQGQLRKARWTEYQQSLEIIPGMESILTENLPRLAVVSSSDIDSVQRKLRLVGLNQISKQQIYATQKHHGTKADTYRHAVEGLNTTSSDCLAIEDSLLGVVAAVDAQVEVWGISRPESGVGIRKDELLRAGAARVFGTVSSLREALTAALD
jgi:beta-phosphoglucomutase-like phosphatase (HAD superfamily)